MIQKFLISVSRLYNCHYQLGVNIVAICVDSPIEGHFWFFFGGHSHIPPSFKEHDLNALLVWYSH